MKQEPTFCCIKEMYLNFKDRHFLRIKGWEKTSQSNGPKKKAGVAITVSIKIDNKLMMIKRNEEVYFLFITRKTQQSKFSVLNIMPQYKGMHITKGELLTLNCTSNMIHL